MKADPNVVAHQEWIGFVQPAGLVVSATALVRAGAILPRRDTEGQRLLAECVSDTPVAFGQDPAPALPDFEAFARGVLGWGFSPKGFAGGPAGAIPEDLVVALPELGITLAPDLAVREREPGDDGPLWQLLVQVITDERPFDGRGDGRDLSPHIAMERLLRETGVPAGLIAGPRGLRLISAPRGESSGWLDFQIAEMVTAAGRPICAAMRLLLSQPRLLTLTKAQRLTALLADSRRFQNEVSEKLAEQVLHALYELLRGFQAAHEESRGQLLARELRESPDAVYRGLLTVILRLVFLLYAEERDMLPGGETFVRYYSLGGLFERLRANAAQYPDTMDLRYGAWPQLLALFRAVYDGAPSLAMPPRHGALFEPDRFPFLEGRTAAGGRPTLERVEPPRVADGTVYRALDKLLVLDGERISYRALDVEQIGSVYETMMGFRLELARGRSVAIKAQSRFGAPTTVSLEELLEVPSSQRGKWLLDNAGRKLPAKSAAAVKDALTLEDLHAALAGVVDTWATPDLVATGAMVLQPSEERRRSGSHYTPRSLTAPIVQTTLEPVLTALRGADGRPPRPEEILELKVCDPAMGSGAFLVEVCRELGEALVEAWAVHGGRPMLPADEDERIFAQRLVAQRCLYGVDRNAVAVDLAKMSLWLVTLAREHALTFLDHALRHGDSIVGLTRRQIETFHWSSDAPSFAAVRIGRHVDRVAELRREIREAAEETPDWKLRGLWDEAQHELSQVRLFGDLVLAAFFAGDKPAAREAKRLELAESVTNGTAQRYRPWLQEMRESEKPLVPFHWQIEFPEVFDRTLPGFDAMIGNPPFAGSVHLSGSSRPGYTHWLRMTAENTGGKTDLVAFFFRRAYASIRRRVGAFGLIATNTIRQGDTRESSLVPIVRDGGWIYAATRRLKWPGNAAVTVSVVHVQKSPEHAAQPSLDGLSVDSVSAYLLPFGPSESPAKLVQPYRALLGVKPGTSAFIISDEASSGFSEEEISDLASMEPAVARLVVPYLIGDDLISSSAPRAQRRILDFGDTSESDAQLQYPETLSRLRRKISPRDGAKSWHRFARPAKALRAYLSRHENEMLLCTPETSKWHVMVMLGDYCIPSNRVVVFTTSAWSAFTTLQSQLHETWRREFSSTFEDRLTYVASDCFDTFPLFEDHQDVLDLKTTGQEYSEARLEIMSRTQIGLTDLYNRFHDPYDTDRDIEHLRELHFAVDRAVLAAYGWQEVRTDCEFLLDYEIDEEEWGNKKKPYRLRWPDPVRDEVLARLIALNGERAAEEARSGAAAEAAKKQGRRVPRKQAAAGVQELG